MFTVFNRFPRGTHGWGAKFNGVVLGLLTYLVFHNINVSIAVALGYVLGESFGWGLWVGTLTEHGQYMDENEGKNNGIQWLARKIVPNYKEEFTHYCNMALIIRGFYWWIPTLAPLMFVLPWFNVLSAIVLLSLWFPLACEIGYQLSLKYKFKFLELSGGWTWQEVVYGLMQDIVFIGLFLTYL